MNNSNRGKRFETAIKPLVVGATTALVASQMSNVDVFAVRGIGALPLWAVAGATGMVASYASEIGHNYLFPALGANQRNATLVSTISGPALAGVSLLAVMSALNPNVLKDPNFGFGKTVLLGAGSEVAGAYLYDGVLKSRLQ
jgi:hypothetical protein